MPPPPDGHPRPPSRVTDEEVSSFAKQVSLEMKDRFGAMCYMITVRRAGSSDPDDPDPEYIGQQ